MNDVRRATETEPFTDELIIQNDLVFLAHSCVVSRRRRPPESRVMDLHRVSVGDQDWAEVISHHLTATSPMLLPELFDSFWG